MNTRRWHCCGLMGLAAGMVWIAHALAADIDQASAAPFGPPIEDDRIYGHVLLNELEGRFGGGADPSFRWDGEAWAGTDSNRLWIKTQGQMQNGQVEGGDQEILYDRPISPFFDLQGGLRYDLDSRARRGWAAFGIEGLAPQFFEVSATVYASDSGHLAAKGQLSYEMLLTQRLILEPSLEVNAYTRPDPERDVGSGVSDLEAGVRIRYEISRKVAPYFGAVYERTYGPADGARSGTWRLALGVRVWY